MPDMHRHNRRQKKKLAAGQQVVITANNRADLPSTVDMTEAGVAGKVVVQYQEETVVSRSSPIPDPTTFAEYERCLPGAADRILSMAEREQAAEHQFRSDVVKMDSGYLERGQKCGLFAVISICLAAAVIAYCGAPKAAAWLVGTVVLGLAGAFFTGRRGRGLIASQPDPPKPGTGIEKPSKPGKP